MSPSRFPLEVAVGDILDSDQPVFIRGWTMVPREEHGPISAVVYCLAGGGCATPYFDLHVEGMSGYSMAEHFCDAGVMVVAFDHPGVGESDPVPDSFRLTPSLVARCHDRAVRVVTDGLASGTLVPERAPIAEPLLVGLGHSMGGLVAVVQQGLWRTFDLLVVLGHSGGGLPEVLTEAELEVTAGEPNLLEIEDRIQQLARKRFAVPSEVPRRQPERGVFFTDDVPEPVRAAFARATVPLLFTCGLTAMIPNSAAVQAATIDVPVFLCLGDHDLAADRFGAVGHFRSAASTTAYLLRDSGHCHNQASSRAQLWRRVLNWIGHLGQEHPAGPSPAHAVANDRPARVI